MKRTLPSDSYFHASTQAQDLKLSFISLHLLLYFFRSRLQAAIPHVQSGDSEAQQKQFQKIFLALHLKPDDSK